ncbi:MAG: AMP-binding protein, partial [Sedimentisphaerales bacterium]|nr:AMP-binding protein [Sedimentisphaerales bacterium]
MIEFDPVLVHEWLSRSARRFPDKHALIYGQQRWTYQQLDRHSTHLAAALMKAGVQRHDRVVVLLNNSPEMVIALYGILKAAATFILLEASVKGPKLKYILQNSSAQVLITHTNKVKVIRDALGDSASEITTVWVGPKAKMPDGLSCSQMCWDDIFSPLADRSADRNHQTNHNLPRCIDVDLASLIYTSGSTGQPKGVMCTHHNMISAARSIIQYIDNSEDDIILTVLPLSFDYGLYQVIMAFMFGGTVVLETSFMYLHRVLERIALEKVTGFPVVPTIVAMLLRMQNIGKYDFSTLKYITNTGAALPVEHIRRLRTIFPQVKIFSMFGLTECKRVGYMPPAELDRRPSSVGRA